MSQVCLDEGDIGTSSHNSVLYYLYVSLQNPGTRILIGFEILHVF